MATRLIVLALCFLGFAAYTARVTGAEVIPPHKPLSDIGMTLGQWSGREAPRIADNVLEVLGVDEFVNRIYYAPSGVVSLYIGYYESQRSGDSIHSPMNCLPGAGWQPMATSYLDIAVPNRPAPIRVKRVLIQKGTDKQVVLYWYHSHGRVIGNEYMSKILMVYDAARLNRSDAALVRVVSPVLMDGNEQAADDRAIDFTQTLFDQIDHYLPL